MKSTASSLHIDVVSNGYLVREPLQCGLASSHEKTFVFSSADALGEFVSSHFRSGEPPAPAESLESLRRMLDTPVVASPAPAKKPVDLRGCVKGQKLLLRDGSIATYGLCTDPGASDGACPHQIVHAEGLTSTAGHDGMWAWSEHPWDVLEILPLEDPKPETPAVSMADVRALQPGDVVVLNNGERSTVTKKDGSATPVQTDRKIANDETCWFHADGRLRCAKEDNADAPRIVAIEKAGKVQWWPTKVEDFVTHSTRDDVPDVAQAPWRLVTEGKVRLGDVVKCFGLEWARGFIGSDCSMFDAVYRHPRYDTPVVAEPIAASPSPASKPKKRSAAKKSARIKFPACRGDQPPLPDVTKKPWVVVKSGRIRLGDVVRYISCEHPRTAWAAGYVGAAVSRVLTCYRHPGYKPQSKKKKSR